MENIIEAHKEPSVLNASQSNEIARKRKELEEDIDNAIHDGDDYTRGMCYLNGFTLGVEMARKEFLDKFDLWIEEMYDWDKHTEQIVNKFKQSLDTPSTKPSITETSGARIGKKPSYEDKPRENILKENSK